MRVTMVVALGVARSVQALRGAGGVRPVVRSAASGRLGPSLGARPSLAVARRAATLSEEETCARPFLGASEELPSRYDFSMEGSLYKWWESKGYFERGSRVTTLRRRVARS